MSSSVTFCVVLSDSLSLNHFPRLQPDCPEKPPPSPHPVLEDTHAYEHSSHFHVGIGEPNPSLHDCTTTFLHNELFPQKNLLKISDMIKG